MAKILVQNNCCGQVQIQLPSSNPTSKGQTVELGDVIFLAPGINSVDAAAWEVAKKNGVVQKLLKEVIASTQAPEQDPRMVGRVKLVEMGETPDENPLKGMKPVQALKVIDETLNVDTLAEWLASENREEVRKAIQKQIAEINAPMLSRGAAIPAVSSDPQS